MIYALASATAGPQNNCTYTNFVLLCSILTFLSLKEHMSTSKSTTYNVNATVTNYGTQLTVIMVSYQYKSNRP